MMANVPHLQKKYNGPLKEYKDCVFLCIGTGIGGAAFINNTFLKPTRNSGFEFGHMIIEKKMENNVNVVTEDALKHIAQKENSNKKCKKY